MGNLKTSFTWKLLERFGVQGIQFVLQVILARLLNPEHYGVLSLMLIFTTLANVFVQNGFNTALIQNKDVTDEDYSSVFWMSLGISCILYAIIFFTAPLIGEFYEMPDLVAPLRVLALVLFPGAFNSVQLAKVSRELNFKKVFFSSIGGVVISGIAGIVLAYMGAGLLSLVVQYLLNTVVACVVMLFTVRWYPKLVINWGRIKVLFSFGWKLLVSSLIDTLYQDLSSLVIGKKYNESTLGYYNRGKQFPQFVITAINSTVQSVMLPAMSAKQDDKAQVKFMTRQSIMLTSYVIFPMLAGLAAVSTPLVRLILTDKWLPCVPYLQIFCFSFAFWPIHSSNLQAINAVGKSDIFLKLEIIKKSIGIIVLIAAVVLFDTPIAIAMTGVITTFTSCFINANPNKKLIGYSYREQMKDIIPPFVACITMFGIVFFVGNLLSFNSLVVLVVQVVVGVVYYVVASAVFRVEAFLVLLNMFKNLRMRRKKA